MFEYGFNSCVKALLFMISAPERINHLLTRHAQSQAFLSITQIAMQCCPLKESLGKTEALFVTDDDDWIFLVFSFFLFSRPANSDI